MDHSMELKQAFDKNWVKKYIRLIINVTVG